jgi:hypothetical protein
MIACGDVYVGMSNIFQAIRLLLIIRQFNLLLIFDNLEWLFSECLETDPATHHDIGYIS